MKTKALVALVTGASSGIGQACAEHLANAGLTVYGTSRHPARRHRRDAFRMLRLDVRHDSSVKTCVDEVLAESGRIDILVNNAGIAVEAAVEETSLDEIENVFETNFFGAVRMIHAVLPGMRKRHAGRIVNIGSMAAFLPMPFSAAYCASKHALHGLTESLDHEVRNLGIRVCVIEPGFIRTDVVEHAAKAETVFEPYVSARLIPGKLFREQIDDGVEPDVVARIVVEASLTDSPRLVYLPDGVASFAALLRTVVPEPLFDFVFRRRLQIDRN